MIFDFFNTIGDFPPLRPLLAQFLIRLERTHFRQPMPSSSIRVS
jgi:hypothetical protein